MTIISKYLAIHKSVSRLTSGVFPYISLLTVTIIILKTLLYLTNSLILCTILHEGFIIMDYLSLVVRFDGILF